MNDGLTERVVEVLASHLDPFTGRLRPSDFAATMREIAARLEVSWPAVALRIPSDVMPSKARVEAHYAQRRFPPCLGCAVEDCLDCQKSATELGRFNRESLLAMYDLATATGLDYGDIRREMRRRDLRRTRGNELP